MNWIARIFMGLLGLAFFAGLLVALCLYLVFATIRWLLTGQKPQVVLVWQQFSQLRKGGLWRGQPDFGAEARTPEQGDVVDVEAREVRPEQPSPKWLK
jgi:hypothetical protein